MRPKIANRRLMLPPGLREWLDTHPHGREATRGLELIVVRGLTPKGALDIETTTHPRRYN